MCIRDRQIPVKHRDITHNKHTRYEFKKLVRYCCKNKIDIGCNYSEISTTFVDIRDELLEEVQEIKETQRYKCPELKTCLNGIPVVALIDTGSQINAISAEWYNKHRSQMGKLNLLKLTNTVVKGAVGKKSKQITQQILMDVKIGQYMIDSVFIIVPDLIRECIIGIGLLQESKNVLLITEIIK